MSDAKNDPASPSSADKSAAIDPVGAIVNDAIAGLKSNSDHADAEKKLNILKTAGEIEKMRAEAAKAHADTTKVTLDATLARKQMRAAFISSLFAPLVPLASLLTVVVTLLVSREQMRSTDQLAVQKAEETYWSAFQDSVDKSSPDKLLSTPTFLSRLRKFSSSDKYKKEILDIELQLLAGVTSDAAFKQLWKLWSSGIDDSNITSAIELARGKKQQIDHLAVDCKQIKATQGILADDPIYTYLGVCSPNYSMDDLSKAIPDPATLKSVVSLKATLLDLNSIIYFLTAEIVNYIKTSSNKTSGPKRLDISGIVLSGANFEDVDLSLMNLTQTTFFYSRFQGAILTSTTGTYDYRGSTWWEADKIDQTYLPYLIVNLYPKKPGFTYPSGYDITKEQYATKIAKLCTIQKPICSAACLRFAAEAQPSAPECQLTQ